MHEQLRIKSLLEKMQGNTITLVELQGITDIDPLFVGTAIINYPYAPEAIQ